MKIAAFEVRTDELRAFARAKETYKIDLELHEERLTAENLDLVNDCTGVAILGDSRIDRNLLNALKARGVRTLATRTIGTDHIDTAYAKQIGIRVCHASYAPDGVADYTIMMMLLCLRHYKESLWKTNVNDFSMKGLQGREIRELTVGVIGTGSIGTQVIRDLSGFGPKILAYNPHEHEDVKQYAEYVDLDTLYKESDLITLHLPLKEETYHLINEDTLSKMKDGVILINCARGGLMDVDCLINGIESRKIGALGLDCIETEEDIVHKDWGHAIVRNREMAYLRQFPNVVHTQHIAFYTDAAVRSMVFTAIEGIVKQ